MPGSFGHLVRRPSERPVLYPYPSTWKNPDSPRPALPTPLGSQQPAGLGIPSNLAISVCSCWVHMQVAVTRRRWGSRLGKQIWGHLRTHHTHSGEWGAPTGHEEQGWTVRAGRTRGPYLSQCQRLDSGLGRKSRLDAQQCFHQTQSESWECRENSLPRPGLAKASRVQARGTAVPRTPAPPHTKLSARNLKEGWPVSVGSGDES